VCLAACGQGLYGLRNVTGARTGIAGHPSKFGSSQISPNLTFAHSPLCRAVLWARVWGGGSRRMVSAAPPAPLGLLFFDAESSSCAAVKPLGNRVGEGCRAVPASRACRPAYRATGCMVWIDDCWPATTPGRLFPGVSVPRKLHAFQPRTADSWALGGGPWSASCAARWRICLLKSWKQREMVRPRKGDRCAESGSMVTSGFSDMYLGCAWGESSAGRIHAGFGGCRVLLAAKVGMPAITREKWTILGNGKKIYGRSS